MKRKGGLFMFKKPQNLFLGVAAAGLIAFSPISYAATQPEPAPVAGMVVGRDGSSVILEKMPGRVQPAVTADTTRYDEDTDRYVLSGHVRIAWDNSRVITTDEAQLSARTGEIWTQGSTTLQDIEPVFKGDALYVSFNEKQAWFFGQRCGMSLPGLTIHSDTIAYDWENRVAEFSGHVLYIAKDKTRACGHLIYDIARNQAK